MSFLTRLHRTSVVSPDNAPGQYPPGYVLSSWDAPPPICHVVHEEVLQDYLYACRTFPDIYEYCNGPQVGQLLARRDGWIYEYRGGTTWVAIAYDKGLDLRSEGSC